MKQFYYLGLPSLLQISLTAPCWWAWFDFTEGLFQSPTISKISQRTQRRNFTDYEAIAVCTKDSAGTPGWMQDQGPRESWRDTVEGKEQTQAWPRGRRAQGHWGALSQWGLERLLYCRRCYFLPGLGWQPRKSLCFQKHLHLPFTIFTCRLNPSQADSKAESSLPCSQMHRCVTVP